MRSALYYPDTSVENESLVKSALLLWDRLEYIIPYSGFSSTYENPLIARAMELIGAPRVPTDAERRETHTHVEDLVTRQLPPQFFYCDRGSARNDDYEMYPQKLMPETWQMLRECHLAGDVLPDSDYPMTEPAGLTVMSILADCCAGSTRSRVTDRGDAYATLSGILGADSGNGPRASQETEEQLVPISLEVIDATSIDLETLIKFREREARDSGLTYRDLRYRYLEGLEKYVKQLTTTKGRKSDAEQIKESFHNDMKIDLHNLKAELGSAGRDVLFSKELLVTALAGIGTVASLAFSVAMPILGTITAAGAPATVGGLWGVGNKYLSARRSIMQKHLMAYLYELHKSDRRAWRV